MSKANPSSDSSKPSTTRITCTVCEFILDVSYPSDIDTVRVACPQCGKNYQITINIEHIGGAGDGTNTGVEPVG